MNFISESPLLFVGLVGSAVVAVNYGKLHLAAVIFVLLLFMFYFYRVGSINPTTYPPGTILSPCWGTLRDIKEHEGQTHYIVYLSPLNIHTQYYPVSGVITKQIYDRSGKFYLAFDIGKSHLNEKMITTIKPDDVKIPGPVIVQRIAGSLVRRITNKHDIGDQIDQGQYMGMIKFGSRVDIILPKGSIPQVKIGQQLDGPNTILATF